MAFFKFRLPGQQAAEAQGNPGHAPAESVDTLRRRARHRLIGASVLVLIGVIGFPLVFDTQPRPVSADLVVDIPDRNERAPARSAATAPAPALATAAALDPKEEVVGLDVPAAAKAATEKAPSASVPTPAPQSKVAEVKPADAAPAAATKPTDSKTPDAKTPEAKTPEAKTPEAKAPVADAKPAHKPSDDKSASRKDAAGRFVVQVGAFSDEAKVREVRGKAEKVGFKTYTQVTDSREGKRTRVRVGPFGSRDEADKAAAKLRHLGLQPQILSL